MTFCLSQGDKQFVSPPGTNISYIQERGGQTFLTHRRGSGKTCFVGGGGGFDDVEEEIDVSEANILVSRASKLSAGARILGAHRSLKFYS